MQSRLADALDLEIYVDFPTFLGTSSLGRTCTMRPYSQIQLYPWLKIKLFRSGRTLYTWTVAINSRRRAVQQGSRVMWNVTFVSWQMNTSDIFSCFARRGMSFWLCYRHCETRIWLLRSVQESVLSSLAIEGPVPQQELSPHLQGRDCGCPGPISIWRCAENAASKICNTWILTYLLAQLNCPKVAILSKEDCRRIINWTKETGLTRSSHSTRRVGLRLGSPCL